MASLTLLTNMVAATMLVSSHLWMASLTLLTNIFAINITNSLEVSLQINTDHYGWRAKFARFPALDATTA